jgi:hypothetical protein
MWMLLTQQRQCGKQQQALQVGPVSFDHLLLLLMYIGNFFVMC